MLRKLPRWVLFLVVVASGLLSAGPALAQVGLEFPLGEGPGSLQGPADDDSKGDKVTARAYFTQPDANRRAWLSVTAQIADGWHIYSITQKPGGPIKTTIKLPGDSQQFNVLGSFTPDPVPSVHTDAAFPGIPLEEHSGQVTWRAPIEFMPNVDVATLKFAGAVNAQACAMNCIIPQDYKFTAELKSAANAINEKVDNHVRISGHIEPRSAAPGDTVRLTLIATPNPGYHIYAISHTAPENADKPTIVALSNLAGWNTSKPQPNAAPQEGKTKEGKTQRYHQQPVEWTIDVKIPADAKPGEYPISGAIGYTVCSETSCDPPAAAHFETLLPVGTRESGRRALEFSNYEYRNVVTQLPKPAPSLWYYLAIAFGGGIILNLMPCVLPVIGLKLFSFIQQSGHERKKILALNLWYSAGVLSVFLILATLAAAAKLGLSDEGLAWGEQFQSTTFNVVMSAIVFVFALSFLGVWEVPIPGFVGGSKASQFAAKEGPGGAFAKGILSTVLATPCSGPMLGPVFGFTLTQDVIVIYALFAAIGLGMSIPYIIVGLFPHLIKFLPKPGAWMDTLKQVLGFLLLATVVFIFTFLNKDYLVPTFALLIGLWFGCWMIGRIPITADSTKKATGWIGGCAVAGLVGWASFTYLTPQKQLIPWQPFSRTLLADLQNQGKTIMVDFTADWCLTCKTNLKLAINRQAVLDKLNQHGTVPLLADWTNHSPEIKETLAKLQSQSIPVLAIFPAGKPNEPIILRDLISMQEVLDALESAGPSKPVAMARRE